MKLLMVLNGLLFAVGEVVVLALFLGQPVWVVVGTGVNLSVTGLLVRRDILRERELRQFRQDIDTFWDGAPWSGGKDDRR